VVDHTPHAKNSNVRVLDVPGRPHHIFPMNIELAPFANMVMAVNEAVGSRDPIGASWDLDGGHCVKRWWLT
jgi:hypothetical protein